MKFILNEERTLDEANTYKQRKVKGINNQADKKYTIETSDNWSENDKNLYNYIKGEYGDQRAKDTVNSIRKAEENGEQSERDYWNKEANIKTNNDQETKQTNNSNNSNDNNSSDDSIDYNAEDMPDEVRKAVKKLSSIHKEGTQQFLKAIKSNINNPNFPFTKLMMKPLFWDRLGISLNESLNEAGFFGSMAGLGEKGLDLLKYNKNNKSPFVKFIRIYNGIIRLNNNIANQYINSPNAIIYNKEMLSKIKNDGKENNLDNMPKIINIDAAAIVNKDSKLQQKLFSAIKGENGLSLSKMDDYTFNGDNDKSNLETAAKYISKLSKDDQEKLFKTWYEKRKK